MPANVQTMFSGRRQVPWHRLGTIVEGTPTSAEAIKLAGLDWEVEKHPLFARIPLGTHADGSPKGVFKRVDSLYATVRADSNTPLGVVGSRYTPVQNRDLFGLLDSIVADGAAQYETAGALGGGETVWMLLVTPDRLQVAGDEVRPYFLATSSHDGSSRLIVRNVATRVVCANTLAAAMGEHVARQFVAGHTSSVHARMKKAADLLGIMRESNRAFLAAAEDLLARSFGRSEFETLAKALLPPPDASDPTTSTREVNGWERRFEALMRTAGAPDLANIRDTAWGALNAVADYEQHHARAKGSEQEQLETLFRRSFLGSGLTSKAYELLAVRA